MRRGVKFVVLLAALMVAAGGTPSFANPGWGYTEPINPPPGDELNHAQILGDVYNQNFTASGLDYVGDGDVTAIRVWDFDDIDYYTAHVYNYEPNDVDQIWTDGAVTVTASAKYAWFEQAFGWNEGGTLGTNFTLLVDDTNIGQTGVSFTITEDQEFLWGHQAKTCSWYEPGYEWWSRESENGWCGSEEDHMVTYHIEGASTTGETVWMIFIEDDKFIDSDFDYNDFVIEIRAIPEPATICLLALGGLALRRKRRT